MWRAAIAIFVLLFVTWLEFTHYPGHTYLGPASQPYVAALEHLKWPGYLSRDLAATHPNFGLTAYDELTLFLSDLPGCNLQRALLSELFVSRLSSLFALFLLARAAGVRASYSIALASLLNLGTYLPGIGICLFGNEPVPRAIALGPLLLALGLFTHARMMLAGFAAGCAFLLDPFLTLPVWTVWILALIFDRHLRPQLRSLTPLLIVFVLLLANLAQLQQGAPDSQLLLGKLSNTMVRLTQFRAPEYWITLWTSKFVHLYLALFVVFVWALTRVWPLLTRPAKWILTCLPLMATLSLPASAVLLDHFHWRAMLAVAPLHLLFFLVLLTWLLCGIAAARAVSAGRYREATYWLAPTLLVFALVFWRPRPAVASSDTTHLANWAETNTWGSSVFLFPDAGRSADPGRFRAESRRALWVDWPSGQLVINHDPELAREWFERWRSTMEEPADGARLEAMLSLPIDYFVFARNRIIQARTESETRPVVPVYTDPEFAVYEASSLRMLPGKLLVDGR